MTPKRACHAFVGMCQVTTGGFVEIKVPRVSAAMVNDGRTCRGAVVTQSLPLIWMLLWSLCVSTQDRFGSSVRSSITWKTEQNYHIFTLKMREHLINLISLDSSIFLYRWMYFLCPSPHNALIFTRRLYMYVSIQNIWSLLKRRSNLQQEAIPSGSSLY